MELDNAFDEIIEEEVLRHSVEAPSMSAWLNSLTREMKGALTDWSFLTISDVFTLGLDVRSVPLPEGLPEGPLEAIRCRISRRMISLGIEHVIQRERAAVGLGEITDVVRINKLKLLTTLVQELVDYFTTQPCPERLTPHWIRVHMGIPFYSQMMSIIENNGFYDWGVVRNLLPVQLREIFFYKLKEEAVTTEELEEYRGIAEKLGPEALSEFLVASGKINKNDFQRTTDLIAQYLGEVESDHFTPQKLSLLPDAVFEAPGLRNLIFIKLRNWCYGQLIVAHGENAAISDYKNSLENLLNQGMDPTRLKQQELVEDLKTYWKEIFEVEAPERLNDHVVNKEGVSSRFPSLRQRVAMVEMKNPGSKKFIAFTMGSGKTGTAFLAKEHVGAKKMLYLCPPRDLLLRELHGRIKKYYKSGNEPSSAVIASGVDKENWADILNNNEVVFVPYSMLSSQGKDGRTLAETIKETPFDFVVADEAHWAKNPDGVYTDNLFDIVNGIPDLYEKGRVMLLSGTPAPNEPEDILSHLKIFDRTLYGDLKVMRGTSLKCDPLVLRNTLLNFLLVLDEYEDLDAFCRTHSFDLGPKDRAAYAGVFDQTDSIPQRMHALELCLNSPGLFAEEVEDTLLREAVGIIAEWLEKNDVVLVIENIHAEGVTRGDDKPFIQRFKALLREQFHQEAVTVEVIDGDTPKKERERIIQRSKNKLGKKILFAMSTTIREGIDLSHIHKGLMLEPSYTIPDRNQMIRRCLREGNTDFELVVLLPNDTISQGIGRHADYKYRLVHRLMHGGTIREADSYILDSLLGKNGNYLLNQALTDQEKLGRCHTRLHGVGTDVFQNFLERYGEIYAQSCLKELQSELEASKPGIEIEILRHLEREGRLTARDYADIGSGPCRLANQLAGVNAMSDISIKSIDLSGSLLAGGEALLDNRFPLRLLENECISCNSTDMSLAVASYSCDVVVASNLMQFLRHTSYRSEREKLLSECGRILNRKGVLILTLDMNAASLPEFLHFVDSLSVFGFKADPLLTGISRHGESVGATYVITAFRETSRALRLAQVGLSLSRTDGRRVISGLDWDQANKLNGSWEIMNLDQLR